jgi:hypothetical protein
VPFSTFKRVTIDGYKEFKPDNHLADSSDEGYCHEWVVVTLQLRKRSRE